MNLLGAMQRWWCAGLVAIALLASLTGLTTGIAHAEVGVPPLTGHVTDQTGTLTQEQKAILEQTLTAFEARKGTQLAVLMVATTEPETLAQSALRVAEKWRLGRKKVDDGAILLVAKDDRAVRIEVGYGLEGALSDIVSNRIIGETLLPRFKAGDYFGGIQAGAEQIIRVVDGEPLPEPQGRQGNAPQGVQDFVPMLFIAALAIGGVLRRIFGRLGGSLVTGAVVTGLAWLVVGTLLYAVLAGIASMFVTLIGAGTVLRGVGGMYGGGGGSSGGGGFSGGGGGFGGGGASGRW